MFKVNFKVFALLLVILFLALCSINARANVPNLISIVGPSQVSVGKTNVKYRVDCLILDGTYLSCNIYVLQNYEVIASNEDNGYQTYVYVDIPTNECTLRIEAEVWYERDSFSQHYACLQETKYVYVCKPNLQTVRLGLDEISYTNVTTTVPVNWNVDDDDRSAYGGGTNPNYGEDYKQYVFLPNNFKNSDDDLYSIKAYVGNTALDTARCNLKIKTSDFIRLWYSQNKSALCCDSNSIFETNCNIRVWFDNKANSNGNRLYAEWVGALPGATNAFIDFYCNNVQFAKLRYKGYAFTEGALPNAAERAFFETNCYFLDGCEWRIAKGGGVHKHDRNSISESIDPTWERYGVKFVATTSAPLCTNIYYLRTAMYNNFQCRCISMDSFNDQNSTFSESDATAFFTINNFWHDNFEDLNTSPLYSDIIYYNGQFAARRIPDSDRLNCHPSWAMVTSRFFNRPRIVHRAEQLGPIKTIQKTYIMVPSLEPESHLLEEE